MKPRPQTRRQKIAALRVECSRLQSLVDSLRQEIRDRNNAHLGYHDDNVMLIQVSGRVMGQISQCRYAFSRVDLTTTPDPREYVVFVAGRVAAQVYEGMTR